MPKQPIRIITEGAFDRRVLESVLNHLGKKELVEIHPASGYSSALSKALSFAHQNKKPIILVLDTDTADEKQSSDKKSFVKSYLNINSNEELISVIWAVPELEAIFFENKDFIESFLNKKISDELWEFSKSSPKKFWELVSGTNRDQLVKIIEDQEGFKNIRNSKEVRELEKLIDKYTGEAA